NRGTVPRGGRPRVPARTSRRVRGESSATPAVADAPRASAKPSAAGSRSPVSRRGHPARHSQANHRRKHSRVERVMAMAKHPYSLWAQSGVPSEDTSGTPAPADIETWGKTWSDASYEYLIGVAARADKPNAETASMPAFIESQRRVA